ncbi:hypothetical protein V6N13_074051 [Hibiscus sabdariffa]
MSKRQGDWRSLSRIRKVRTLSYTPASYVPVASAPAIYRRRGRQSCWKNRPRNQKPYGFKRGLGIPYGCEGPCKVQSFDTLVDVPDTGSVTRISNVERGIGLTHRTGRRFCIKSVFFTGKVWMGDEVSKRAHTNIVMFWLVRDRRPEFAPLEFGKVFNMFDNEPVTATITADMRDRFQVLRRWSASVTGGTYAHREQIYVSRFFKGLNHRVTYNHQDQPIYENHTDNALFLYMACTHASNPVYCTMKARVYFYDSYYN